MTTVRPFHVDADDEKLDTIRRRLSDVEWPAVPAGVSWELGTDQAVLRQLVERWRTGYDWRVQERGINSHEHQIVHLDSAQIHVVRRRNPIPGAVPLLLLHGWPYSFYSFLHLLDPLQQAGFDVVVPSLPGHGFSSIPTQPIGPRAVAELMDRLMRTLGYKRYVAAGGDWGAQIASLLGYLHPDHLLGVHVHHLELRHHGAGLGAGPGASSDLTAEEHAFAVDERDRFTVEGAYYLEQQTRPQTLAHALTGHPVGAASWMLEKFHAWSDRRDREFLDIFDLDHLITEVMIYEITGTHGPAMWLYTGQGREQADTLPPGERVRVPVGVAAYPDPVFPVPPPSFVARSHNLVRYTVPDRGGHFPFLENPASYVRELTSFVTQLGLVRG